jgi:hypothetical protein
VKFIDFTTSLHHYNTSIDFLPRMHKSALKPDLQEFESWNLSITLLTGSGEWFNEFKTVTGIFAQIMNSIWPFSHTSYH